MPCLVISKTYLRLLGLMMPPRVIIHRCPCCMIMVLPHEEMCHGCGTLPTTSFDKDKRLLTFDTWYSTLMAMAVLHGCRWVVADKESHRESYNNGSTPDEELTDQIGAAQYSV